MNKKRLKELQDEYQEDEKKLNQLENAKQQMIQAMLIKRGRILELEECDTQSKTSSKE